MSTISQTIPTLLGGVSQQPDNRKRPGQVKEAINTFPDFALGMLKRSGSKLISRLWNADDDLTECKWFPILQTGDIKYIAQYDIENKNLRVWTLKDGSLRVVKNLNHEKFEDSNSVDVSLSDLIEAAGTFNDNKRKTDSQLKDSDLQKLQEYGAALAKHLDETNSSIKRYLQFNNTYSSGNIDENIVSGVLTDSAGVDTMWLNNSVVTGSQYSKGTERTSDHPILASQGYRIYELEEEIAGVAFDATKEEDYIDKFDPYKDINISTDIGTYNSTATELKLVSGDAGYSNYLDDPDLTPEDLEFFTLNDYTFVINKKKKVEMHTDQTTGTHENQAQVVFTSIANSQTCTLHIKYQGDSDKEGENIIPDNHDFVEYTSSVTSLASNASVDKVAEDWQEDINPIIRLVFENNDTNNIQWTGTPTPPVGITSKDVDIQDANGATISVPMKLELDDNGRVKLAYTDPGTISAIQTSITSNSFDINQEDDFTVQSIPDFSFNGANPVARRKFKTTVLHSGIFIEADIDDKGNPKYDVDISSDQKITFYVLRDTIENVTKLPAQSKHGSVLKIVNSDDIDIDDMYVKFEADSRLELFGPGHWEETTKPGITYKFNKFTMPHRIVRKEDGSDEYFVVEPFDDYDTVDGISWNNRIVGDDTTNPIPSFVGDTINGMFFYRNRLGFISGQNVVLSKAGDIFNFWNTTAQTATNDDPIDISTAGKRPVYLKHAQTTSIGLVLYSDVEQFILTTDSDILAPTTAKINTLSSYETDENVSPVSLGTSQAFINKTPLYTRLFELNDINIDQPPLMNDITNIVPEYIPKDINSMVASPGLSLVSLAKTGGGVDGKTTLYQYRFLQQERDTRVVNCWYKWDVTGNLVSQFFDANTYYVVVENSDQFFLVSFDLNQSNEKGFLTLPTGEKTDVCLDWFSVNPHREALFELEVISDPGNIGVGYHENVATTTPGTATGLTVNVNVDDNNNVTEATVCKRGENYQDGDQITVPSLNNLVLKYVGTSEKTRIVLPYNHVDGGRFIVLALGGYIGDDDTDLSSSSIGFVLEPTVRSIGDSSYVDIDGDYIGRNLIIGYNYDMSIDLPKLYPFQVENNNIKNDDVSDLIIHRLKVKTGLSGPVDYKVNITGIPDWANTVNVTQPYEYNLNSVNMQANSTHVVPIYQRNKNLDVRIEGTTPFPVSLLGLDWEGKQNNGFYRRG